MTERIDNLDSNPFLDGPAQYLCKNVAEQLLLVPQWVLLFGDRIDGYKRMDYGIRNLPALRIYNNTYRKMAESWFIEGDLMADVILPANLRRDDLQKVQDVVSSALLQQFRRPTFFDPIMSGLVPGLNELGKVFSVDKSLGFQWGDGSSDWVPLTQITINFKIDLRQWDLYLENTDRTKDDPFERTLGDLEVLIGTIQGLNDDTSINVEIGSDEQDLGEEELGGE